MRWYTNGSGHKERFRPDIYGKGETGRQTDFRGFCQGFQVEVLVIKTCSNTTQNNGQQKAWHHYQSSHRTWLSQNALQKHWSHWLELMQAKLERIVYTYCATVQSHHHWEYADVDQLPSLTCKLHNYRARRVDFMTAEHNKSLMDLGNRAMNAHVFQPNRLKKWILSELICLTIRHRHKLVNRRH